MTPEQPNKIYVIDSGNGSIKVGISKQPICRLQELESAGGFTAKHFCFFSLDDAARIEQYVHNNLEAVSQRHKTSKLSKSEWFLGTSYLLAMLMVLEQAASFCGLLAEGDEEDPSAQLWLFIPHMGSLTFSFSKEDIYFSVDSLNTKLKDLDHVREEKQ